MSQSPVATVTVEIVLANGRRLRGIDGLSASGLAQLIVSTRLETPFSLALMPRGAFATVIEGPARRLNGDRGKSLTIEPALTEALLSDIDAGVDAMPCRSMHSRSNACSVNKAAMAS